jgi:hypothetical protein
MAKRVVFWRRCSTRVVHQVVASCSGKACTAVPQSTTASVLLLRAVRTSLAVRPACQTMVDHWHISQASCSALQEASCSALQRFTPSAPTPLPPNLETPRESPIHLVARRNDSPQHKTPGMTCPFILLVYQHPCLYMSRLYMLEI